MTNEHSTPAALWNRYVAGDDSARDVLVREHLGLVHHVARQMGGRLPIEAELDELVSAGTMGLISAISSFDVQRGLSFSTFAVPRIRGAILDELRRQDHVPRSVRRKTRDLGSARAALARTLGRNPNDVEMSERLGVPRDTVRRWELDVEGGVHVSLERSQPERHEKPVGAELVDDEAPSIEDLLTREQEVARLQDAIEELKDQERTVLALFYFEELKLGEIAGVMGLSPCRISQIRAAALVRLRARLARLRAA
jgi:RNA polymerase sigma factor FliA